MSLTVKFIGALRHISGKTQLTIGFKAGASIKTIVETINQELPQLKHIFPNGSEPNGNHSNLLILVNGKEISALDGYETKLDNGDEIVFVPVIHGG